MAMSSRSAPSTMKRRSPGSAPSLVAVRSYPMQSLAGDGGGSASALAGASRRGRRKVASPAVATPSRTLILAPLYRHLYHPLYHLLSHPLSHLLYHPGPSRTCSLPPCHRWRPKSMHVRLASVTLGVSGLPL